MADNTDDYAVRAAREWFAPSREAVEQELARHKHPCDRCDGVLQSMEQNAQQLATIIRKYVAEDYSCLIRRKAKPPQSTNS